MSRRRCRNCQVTVRFGVLCRDCVRCIAVTVISELVLAAIYGGYQWIVR